MCSFAQSTIVDSLRSHASARPTSQCYVWWDGENETAAVTFAELDARARAIAATLQAKGLSGERALMFYGPGIEFIEAFLGCLYANVVPAPLYAPKSRRDPGRFSTICQNSRARAALTRTRDLKRVQDMFLENETLAYELVVTDTVDSGMGEHWQSINRPQNDLAYLQYTSGSTSVPRGIMVGHTNLITNLHSIKNAFDVSSDSVIVSWLPHFHDLGLVFGMLEGIHLGLLSILMAPSTFAVRPLRWLQAISKYKGTHTAGPNFSYDACLERFSPEEMEGVDLSSLRCALNGAEPVRKETIDQFAKIFAPYGFEKKAHCPGYGLAEATLVVSLDSPFTEPEVATLSTEDLAIHLKRLAPVGQISSTTTVVGCGTIVDYTEVVIVDCATADIASPEVVGEIWVKGAGVCLGCWDQPDETKRVFNAYLPNGDGPYLRTGDLGFFHNNQLYIAGRLKDLIIIRGQNHYPQDIERTIESAHTAVARGGGAAFSVEVNSKEHLAVVQEVRRGQWDTADVIGAIRKSIADVHGLQAQYVVLISPKSLPKTSSGKVQRHKCRIALLNGTLRTLASSSLDYH